MQKNSDDITLLLLFTIVFILLMGGLILLILFMHRKKQIMHLEKIDEIRAGFEKAILRSQLEMQEQTFQHISREIHDNINLSLTLVKLNLNTISFNDHHSSTVKISSSIDLLTQSIAQLRDLSKSLDSDLIKRNGLLSVIEEELQKIENANNFKVDYAITGVPVYLESGTELVIFRIIQEALNNVIKHAKTSKVKLLLHYGDNALDVSVCDSGVGFDCNGSFKEQAGLKNMGARVQFLGGRMDLKSELGKGTILNFNIPFGNGEE